MENITVHKGDDMETTLEKLIEKYKTAPFDDLYRIIWNGGCGDFQLQRLFCAADQGFTRQHDYRKEIKA